MSSTFTFVKRGTNSSENLLPTGFVEQGARGIKGTNGTPGSSLYFIDYDPSNSYYKELVQKKLESNYILSNNNNTKLDSRTYRSGDIIMASNKNMYRVIDAISESKYKFDIEYIGTIITDVKQKDDTLGDAFAGVELVGYDSSIKECIVPTNRSMDFDGSIYAKFRVNNLSINTSHYGTLTGDPKMSILIQDYIQDSSCVVLQDDDGNVPTYTFENFYDTDWNVDKITKGIANSITNFIDSSANEQSKKHFSTKFEYKNNHLYTYCEKSFISMKFKIDESPNFIFFDGLDQYNYEKNANTYYQNGPTFLDGEGNDCNTHVNEIINKGEAKWPWALPCSTSYENAFRKLYGLTFKPCIRFTTQSKDSKIYTDYDYYLKIYLKNTKTIQCGDFSLKQNISDDFTQNSPSDPANKELNDNFTFYKTLEFKLTKLGPNSYIDPNDSSSYINRVFISDQSADKLHPSGNNIRINYVSPKNRNIIDSNNDWGSIEYNIQNQYKITKNPEYYGGNDSELYYFSINPYYKTGSYVQYSKRNDEYPCPINFRGGESAYFSGMTIPTFSKSYIENNLTPKTSHEYKTGPFFNNWDETDSELAELTSNLSTYAAKTFDNYALNILSLNENCNVFGTTFYGIGKKIWKSSANTRNEIVSDYVTHKMSEFLLSNENKYEIVAIKKTADANTTPAIIMPISLDKISKQKTT